MIATDRVCNHYQGGLILNDLERFEVFATVSNGKLVTRLYQTAKLDRRLTDLSLALFQQPAVHIRKQEVQAGRGNTCNVELDKVGCRVGIYRAADAVSSRLAGNDRHGI